MPRETDRRRWIEHPRRRNDTTDARDNQSIDPLDRQLYSQDNITIYGRSYVRDTRLSAEEWMSL